MKGIGAFVLVLVVSIGVAIYLVSRPPDSNLDAQEQAWVDGYRSWSARLVKTLDRAQVRMTFSSEARNARLIEPLRSCSTSLIRLGEAPELMEVVERLTQEACGRAEHAVDVNDRFGTASLATVKLNLHEAEDRVVVSRRTMRQELARATLSD